MNSNFYRALEDKFRGTREIIKSRLHVYLPFIETLRAINSEIMILDLGCGRGEWLELLKEQGYTAQGVDLDDSMLEACRKRDLNVQTKDAISFLKGIPDESQNVITGFHIVEHIPFDDVQTLISESLRALKPAGLLILETPNPENLTVGTSGFYLDPTHQRPIPPKLLSFIPEYYGYERVKILRLQEPPESNNSKYTSLYAVINYVSPDYAVIAQKTAEDELISLTNKPFEDEYGTTLEQLAITYDQHVQKIEDRIIQAELTAKQSINILQAIHSSYTWHITAPLRWLEHQIKQIYQQGLFTRIKALVKKFSRPFVLRLMAFTRSRPGLHLRLINISKKLGLHNHLRFIYLNFIHQNNGSAPIPVPSTLQHLTPRARRIYADLKAAVANNQNTGGN